MNGRRPPKSIELGVDWLLRLGLGALFIVAAIGKLRDPGGFAVEIAHYNLFTGLAPWLAVTLPAIELVVGVALIVGPRPWRKAAALSMTLLLVMFTVAVASVVARHIDVDCGCFGRQSGPVSGLTVARDVALLAAALFELWICGAAEAPKAVSAP